MAGDFVSEIIEKNIPYYKKRVELKEKKLVDSVEESNHTLIYDSSSETLEPIYFFILDLMNDFGLETEKYIDNFTSSPGSGHFSELGTKKTAMQQHGTKLLGDINAVLRSILNLIYDLKEFKTRLAQYDGLKNPKKKDAAMLALKQLWMDKVDINKGNSSIKAMALGQAGFQTLIDAFLFVKDVGDVDKVDLNERVKRILRPRVMEFHDWVKNSESELRKRYEMEKTYLKSQVNSLKLYSRWAKPYLKAAEQLEMEDKGRDPAMVKAFNTILLELSIIGKRKINPRDEALSGNLPKDFEKIKTKDYYSCVLIDFRFRGIPQKAGQQQQHYVFGGRAEISFKAYVLNEDEIEKINEEFEESDIKDALKLIEGTTSESLEQMQEDIDYFINEEEQEEQPEKKEDTSNPFKALLGGYDKKEPEKPKAKSSSKEKATLRPETFAEKEYLRKLVADTAKETTFKLFDVYKKVHGMASYT